MWANMCLVVRRVYSQLSGQLAVLLRCLVQREACVLTECTVDHLLEMQGIPPFLHLSSPAP